MRAIVLNTGGGPEVLKTGIVDPPSITAADQVMVRLNAAGINPIDTKIRATPEKFPLQLPAIPGCDGAGIVESIGAAVQDFVPGDEVYYCQPGLAGRQGNYAEYAVVPRALLAHKPKSLTFHEAAAAPLALITAWEALYERARLAAGQTALIHAGAGGVGHLAIQLAKQAGARVITTVSTPDKADFVRSLGADEVIYYRDQNIAEKVWDFTDERGADVVFDTVGGKVLEQSFPATAVYGDVVTILQPAADTDWTQARKRNLRISLEFMLAPTLLDLHEALAHHGEILRQAAQRFDDGSLRITVAGVLPLDQAAEAHRRLENDHPVGKLVLSVD